MRAILGIIQSFYLNSDMSLIISHSGGSRLVHRASGTRSKPPNLNENGQNPILRDSEAVQNFVQIRHWAEMRKKTNPDEPFLG